MKIKTILSIIYLLVAGFIYAGFLLHKSSNPIIFIYSLSYSIFLLVILTILFSPFIIHFFIKKYGNNKNYFIFVPFFIIVIFSYFISSYYYYYTRNHLFDPFLQIHNPVFDNYSKTKNKKTYRILALGGSTTQNPNLPEAERYPTVLKSILQEQYPEINIEVLNAGMMYYTTKHSLINYTTYCKDWQPDLVIVMHAINDLYRSFSPRMGAVGKYNDQWNHYYGPAFYGAKPLPFEIYILNKYLADMSQAWYSLYRLREKHIPLENFLSIAMFERHLSEIVHSVMNDDSKILLITQPFLYKNNMSQEENSKLWMRWGTFRNNIGLMRETYPTVESLMDAMNECNRIIAQIGEKNNIIVVNAENKIEKNLLNFIDDVHYTSTGAKIIAENIADAIIENDYVSNYLQF